MPSVQTIKTKKNIFKNLWSQVKKGKVMIKFNEEIMEENRQNKLKREKQIVPSSMESIELSNGFVTSGANLGIQKALVDHQDLDSLIGRMMQYIEATYQDKEQREAHKGIVKSLCREWLTHIYDWQRGWEIAFHVNPNNRIEDSNDVWTSKYKIN